MRNESKMFIRTKHTLWNEYMQGIPAPSAPKFYGEKKQHWNVKLTKGITLFMQSQECVRAFDLIHFLRAMTKHSESTKIVTTMVVIIVRNVWVNTFTSIAKQIVSILHDGLVKVEHWIHLIPLDTPEKPPLVTLDTQKTNSHVDTIHTHSATDGWYQQFQQNYHHHRCLWHLTTAFIPSSSTFTYTHTNGHGNGTAYQQHLASLSLYCLSL